MDAGQVELRFVGSEAADGRVTDGKMLAFEDPRSQRKKPAHSPRAGEDNEGAYVDYSASYIKPETDDASDNSFAVKQSPFAAAGAPSGFVGADEESSSVKNVSAFGDLSRDFAL